MKEVRPTSGLVLKALFDVLGPMGGRSFLDLFAGTGRVGLEAWRRGARPVAWAEAERARARGIAQALPPGADGTTVVALPLRRAIAWLSKRGLTFDVVFADPPYHEGWGTELLGERGLDGLLAPGGTMIVERSAREELVVPGAWALTDERSYGETRLSFLHLAPSSDGHI